MPDPLYVKEAEVAEMLRHGVDWLRKNAPALEAQYGFPKVDPATGLRHKEAIEKWARERNFRPVRHPERLKEANRENTDAF